MHSRWKRSQRVGVSALILACSNLTASLVLSPAPAGADQLSNASYVVLFKSGVQVDQHLKQLEHQIGFTTHFVFHAAAHGFATRLTAHQVAAVRADPQVASISPDGAISANATVPVLSGENLSAGVLRIGAGTSSTTFEASSVSVAVVDTGVDLTNPDLNVVDGTNCISPGKPSQDDNGHGTHVAGTIAARNNGKGVVGVAPGTKIYSVKALASNGSGTWSQVICGVDWVTAHADAYNIKVVNMSLGGGTSPPLNQAIDASIRAGITYVVAAGNNYYANFANYSPANDTNVLTVTSMNPATNTPSTFTNIPVSQADIDHTIAAPGSNILSDWIPSGTTKTISGTSMAAPHVVGVIALCLGQMTTTTAGVIATPGPCAGLTPAEIIQKMRTDALAHATAVPTDSYFGDPTRPHPRNYYGAMVWSGVPSAPNWGGQLSQGSGFSQPEDVAVSKAGTVFVVDRLNKRVAKVTPSGTQTVGSGFSHAAGVAVDGAGNLYVTDRDPSRVVKVSPSGTQTALPGPWHHPQGVDVDAAGTIYVANTDAQEVTVIPAGGGAVRSIRAGGFHPIGVAVDASGNIYFSARDDNLIHKITAGGVQSVFASGFNRPTGVSVDSTGDVFVADRHNNRVVMVTASGAHVVIGSGFLHPTGVSVDTNGNVYVADLNNNRIIKVLSPPVVGIGSGRATIQWNIPGDPGSGPVTGYTVTANPGGTTCVTIAASCTFTGLAVGRTFTFTVTATNQIGTGLSSLPTAAITAS